MGLNQIHFSSLTLILIFEIKEYDRYTSHCSDEMLVGTIENFYEIFLQDSLPGSEQKDINN